jgi:streptomycin 6-kinase
MIKADSPTGEFAEETEALRLFAGPGMVRVLEIDEEQEVVLMERLEPGTVLAELVPEQDERATSILVSVMRQIWRPAPARHHFPTVERWFKGFEKLRACYDGGCGPFPKRLLVEAETTVAELLATPEPPMLLHGDLHHENILRSGHEWRAIDPKGVVGDPGYELSVLFYNPMPKIFHVPDLRKILARRLAQLAEELNMERERLRGWGLAQCVLSAWWSAEDGSQEPPQDVLACGDIMSSLK